MKVRDKIEVEWVDAQTLEGFIPFDEVMSTKLITANTCGYFIGQDKEKIVISFMNFGEYDTKYFQIIPRVLIKKIKVLR